MCVCAHVCTKGSGMSFPPLRSVSKDGGFSKRKH